MSRRSAEEFTIKGFINVPLQRHYQGDPDGNTLWLWNPTTDFQKIKPALSLESDLEIVKKGHAPYKYLKIRFEGVDTPETHYNGWPGPTGPRVKQNYGILARDMLFQLLGDFFEGSENSNQVILQCRIIKNGKFYDTHKRVIGQIYLKEGSDSINIQMIKSGYAFPLLYESMNQEFTKSIRNLAEEAYDNDAGVWREYTVTPEDGIPAVLNEPDEEINDWGDVNFPKFWRRWISYNYDPLGISSQTFVDWLVKRSDDKLAEQSSVAKFSDAVSPHDYRLKTMPWDFVFRDN